MQSDERFVAKPLSEDGGFLRQYGKSLEKIVIFDSHTDACGPGEALEQNVYYNMPEGILYPPSLLTNSGGNVYLKAGPEHVSEDGKIILACNGKEYELSDMPFILHYGTEMFEFAPDFSSYNWRFMQRKDLPDIGRMAEGFEFHIDPDALSKEAEVRMALESGVTQDACDMFISGDKNPFFNGMFGCATIDDVKSVFASKPNGIFIGEAFSQIQNLGKPETDVGEAVISWMVSEFMKPLGSRKKAYIINNGCYADGRGGACTEDPTKPIVSALSSLGNISELVVFDALGAIYSDTEECLGYREEILRQKNPIVVATKHSGAAYCMGDIKVRAL